MNTRHTLNTMDAKTYKQFLRDKLVAWCALCPAVCAPKESSMSGAADEDNKDRIQHRDEERDEEEEGRIAGEAPELD